MKLLAFAMDYWSDHTLKALFLEHEGNMLILIIILSQFVDVISFCSIIIFRCNYMNYNHGNSENLESHIARNMIFNLIKKYLKLAIGFDSIMFNSMTSEKS